jgi:hypothetical protein
MTEKKNLAEALGRAHDILLADLRKLEQAIRPARGDDLTELRKRLEATGSHIARHFRYEEENGYMPAVRKLQPRLERAAQQLVEEHAQLTESLEALIREAHALPEVNETFCQKVREWVRSLRRHEGRENELVQDAFNLDIGAED